DFQLGVFQDRAERYFGVSDPAEFADPEIMDRLVSTYFARTQLDASGAGASGAAIALTLLQS
ncbi:MAG: flagellar protein, partial [Paracoccaceae bacterium]